MISSIENKRPLCILDCNVRSTHDLHDSMIQMLHLSHHRCAMGMGAMGYCKNEHESGGHRLSRRCQRVVSPALFKPASMLCPWQLHVLVSCAQNTVTQMSNALLPLVLDIFVAQGSQKSPDRQVRWHLVQASQWHASHATLSNFVLDELCAVLRRHTRLLQLLELFLLDAFNLCHVV
jgi:hypothetical protein